MGRCANCSAERADVKWLILIDAEGRRIADVFLCDACLDMPLRLTHLFRRGGSTR